MSWKIHNVPVQISLDQTTPGADNSFGIQDIAKPGSFIGDGVIDNGNMPLRFIVQPMNPATETIDINSFTIQLGQTIQQLDEINNSAGLPLQGDLQDNMYETGNVNGNSGYRPSSEYNWPMFNQLYPGYDHGNTYVREWINGENVNVTNGSSLSTVVTDSDGAGVLVPIILPWWCDKVVMYNYNFQTGSTVGGNQIGNVGIVLAWVKPEFDLSSITMYAFGQIQTNNANLLGIEYVNTVDLRVLQIPINGPSQPVGPVSEDIDPITGEDSSTSTSNSFNLTVEIVEPGYLDGGYDSNINVIPAYNFNSSAQWSGLGYPGNAPTWDGYTYAPAFNASEPWRASINFNPSSYWNEQSYALPEYYQSGYNRYPIMFVLVPNDGYYLSRHNLRVKMVDGTGTDVTIYPPVGVTPLDGSSNFGPHGWVHLTYDDIFGASFGGLPTAYNEWISQSWMPSLGALPSTGVNSVNMLSFFNNGTQSDYNAFISSVNSSLSASTATNPGAQFRGATKYSNVEAYVSSGTINLSQIVNPTEITTAPEVVNPATSLLVDKLQSIHTVSLIDSKSYAQGIPSWGSLITNQPDPFDIQLAREWIANDHGLEFVGGQIPAAYCPSDWAGNVVFVSINNIGSYIPGQAPSDIKICIEGRAMPDDGSTCVDFNVNIDGGGNINSGSQG
tara:strand:- start:1452 stop:3464 length:2013 start_codon:yes stop_codon:yes gene_type:complete